MKYRFAMLALILAVTGCPNNGAPVAGASTAPPHQTPAPTSKPSADSSPEATKSVSTLGVVNAEVLSAAFTPGNEKTFEIYMNPGLFLPKSAQPPSNGGYPTYYTEHPDGNSEHFVRVNSLTEATWVHYETYLEPWMSELEVSLGGTPAATFSAQTPSTLAATFPMSAAGNLVIRPKPGNDTLALRVITYTAYSGSTVTTFVQKDSTLSMDDWEQGHSRGSHHVNASVKVAVRELDGAPVKGLGRENFEIAFASDDQPGAWTTVSATGVQETSDGTYLLAKSLTVPRPGTASYDVQVRVVNRPYTFEGIK